MKNKKSLLFIIKENYIINQPYLILGNKPKFFVLQLY